MRKVIETSTIENEFEFVKQEVYDLQDGMSNAADNMPEQLNTAHAGAAQLLDVAWDYICNCDVPPELCNQEVIWLEWKEDSQASTARQCR